MLKIACALLGLACAAPMPPRPEPWSAVSDYQIVLNVGDVDATGQTDSSVGFQNASDAAEKAEAMAYLIHMTMPPLSEAAAWSTEGATVSVEIRVGSGRFFVEPQFHGFAGHVSVVGAGVDSTTIIPSSP